MTLACKGNAPSVEAVDYGRRVLQQEIDRLRDFERQATTRGDDEAALRWKRIYEWIERSIIGAGEGCVITGFDARWLDKTFRLAVGDHFACSCDGQP